MGWNDRMGVGPGYEGMYDSPEEAEYAYHAAAEKAHIMAMAGGAEMARIRAEIAEINASFAGKESFVCRYCGQEFPMARRVLQACQFCAEHQYN